jgi:hypothetical protein
VVFQRPPRERPDKHTSQLRAAGAAGSVIVT